jgi:ferredoxin
MSQEPPPLHRVCTLDEATALVRRHRKFWITECGCRESAGRCKRSRHDTCLYFVPKYPGAELRPVDRAFVDELLQLARERLLVPRPFRDEVDVAKTAGCCFCCDDCCGYFQDPTEPCAKGTFRARTDRKACNDCGACSDVCHFGARTMVDDVLAIAADRCFGCGLCAAVCPEDCVKLMPRKRRSRRAAR